MDDLALLDIDQLQSLLLLSLVALQQAGQMNVKYQRWMRDLGERGAAQRAA